MLKYIGAALLLIAATVVIKEYRAYLDGREGLMRGYLDFLEFAERKVENSLTPISELYRGFECEALESFIEKIKEGESIFEAYSAADKPPPAADEILTHCFGCFGKGGYSSELSALAEARERLAAVIEREAAESDKHKKLFATLAVALAAGLIILLL